MVSLHFGMWLCYRQGRHSERLLRSTDEKNLRLVTSTNRKLSLRDAREIRLWDQNLERTLQDGRAKTAKAHFNHFVGLLAVIGQVQRTSLNAVVPT